MIDNFIMAEPTKLPINALVRHPDNRPMGLDQDKVDQIAELIAQNGYYGSRPIIVRQIGEQYQIIEGEHRWRACQKLGYTSVLCEVHDCDDKEALTRLIAGNAQSENCPLDVGAAAFKYCEKGVNRHTENENSYTQFAKRTGYSKSTISQNAAAYEVLINSRVYSGELNDNSRVYLKSCAKHLNEIHKAPTQLWPVLVSALLAKEWSVKDTKHFVGKVLEFEVPEKWQTIFMPLPEVIGKYLERLEFSASTVSAIIAEAEKIEQRIATYNVDKDAFVARFHEWLAGGIKDYSWDVRKIIAYGRELQASLEAEERKASEMWMLGDWREHVGKLQDGSVALLLTDPPYGMDYQSDRRTDRREDRKNEVIANDGVGVGPEETKAAIMAMMPKMATDAHTFIFCHWSNEQQIRDIAEACGLKVRGSLIWVKNNRGMGDPKTTFAPRHERIIHAVKGSPILFSRPDDVLFADKCNSDNHPTEKPVELLSQLIEATTTKGELVADPFGGVASTLVASKKQGRKFWGCELNEQYYLRGEERLK